MSFSSWVKVDTLTLLFVIFFSVSSLTGYHCQKEQIKSHRSKNTLFPKIFSKKSSFRFQLPLAIISNIVYNVIEQNNDRGQPL